VKSDACEGSENVPFDVARSKTRPSFRYFEVRVKVGRE